jgi:MFS family permease
MSPAQLVARIFPALGAGAADPTDVVTADEAHNGRMFRFEAPFTNLAFSVGNFYALFAIQLGASNTLVGWLSSGPALISLLWVLPAGRLIQRSKNFLRPMLSGALGHRAQVMLLALIPFLPADWRAPALVALATIGSIPATLWGLSFHSIAAEVFTPKHRALFVGQRWAIANVSGVVVMFALGWLLDLIRFPLNFQVMFLGAPLVALTTLVLIARLRLPPRPPQAFSTTKRHFSLRAARAQIARHRSFIWFEVGVLLGYAAMFFAAPLFRIYWVRDLQAAGSWVGALTATYSIGAVLGNLIWGRLSAPQSDRRLGLITAAGVMIVYPLLSALARSLWPLVAITILCGFFAGGNDLLIFNRVVRQTPRAERPAFIGVHNVVVNVAGFVTPLLSTALIDWVGARPTLLIAGGLGVIGAGAMFLLGWGKMYEGEQ